MKLLANLVLAGVLFAAPAIAEEAKTTTAQCKAAYDQCMVACDAQHKSEDGVGASRAACGTPCAAKRAACDAKAGIDAAAPHVKEGWETAKEKAKEWSDKAQKTWELWMEDQKKQDAPENRLPRARDAEKPKDI